MEEKKERTTLEDILTWGVQKARNETAQGKIPDYWCGFVVGIAYALGRDIPSISVILGYEQCSCYACVQMRHPCPYFVESHADIIGVLNNEGGEKND